MCLDFGIKLSLLSIIQNDYFYAYVTTLISIDLSTIKGSKINSNFTIVNNN